MKRSYLLSLATLAALAVPTLALAANATAPATVTVDVSGQGAASSGFDAVVEAVRQSTISTQVAGAVVALHVKAGDTVRAGQALLQIDARAAEQQVAGSSDGHVAHCGHAGGAHRGICSDLQVRTRAEVLLSCVRVWAA